MTVWLDQPTLNIAHRGARSLAPENTLAAARQALKAGAHAWEFDVCMTADGELLLLHDDTLARTSNVAQTFPDREPWAVHQFTLREIQQLDCGTWFVEQDPFGEIAAGNVPDADAYRGEKAPTLAEALDFTREHDWYVNVEIKDLHNFPGYDRVVGRVLSLVETMSMTERVLISSFNHAYLKKIRARNPTIPLGALTTEPVADAAALLADIEAQTFHPRRDLPRPDDVPTLVWSVNDVAEMQTLIAAGVLGIITDYPQRLATLL